MAAHTGQPAESGRRIFAIAVIVAMIAICVVASPSTAAVVVALVAVIGFGADIVALPSRLIGPEDH